MADQDKEGLNAALTEAMDQVGEMAPEEKAEQLALLPLPLDEDEQATEADRRGPGRPAGSRNKRTEAWTSFLLSNYRSPLEALAQIVAARVEDLAARLDCKRVEAFKLQIMAAKELAPYLHQKQPVALDIQGKPPVSLTIQTGPAEAAPVAQPGDDAVVITGQVLNSEKPEKTEG